MNVRLHPLYGTWLGMTDRCHNPAHKAFKHYGARGITVCEKWRNSVHDFAADVGDRPQGKTLDRIDNDGNYEPGNVRWATVEEQRNNSSGPPCHYITHNGKTQTLTVWAKEIGMSPQALQKRLRLGWSVERALIPAGRALVTAYLRLKAENELLTGKRA